MHIAVSGGPYGNPYALRAFVADARARGAERLCCLGDLGGFGAEVDALWPIIEEAGIECVAGNYDVGDRPRRPGLRLRSSTLPSSFAPVSGGCGELYITGGRA